MLGSPRADRVKSTLEQNQFHLYRPLMPHSSFSYLILYLNILIYLLPKFQVPTCPRLFQNVQHLYSFTNSSHDNDKSTKKTNNINTVFRIEWMLTLLFTKLLDIKTVKESNCDYKSTKLVDNKWWANIKKISGALQPSS